MQKMTVLIVFVATVLNISCGKNDAPSVISETRNSDRESVPFDPSQQEKPNLILITLDTLRADALGSYGQLSPTSPILTESVRKA